MSSVAIIGDIDVVSGFRLGGVKRAEVANSAEEAVAAFDKILDEDYAQIKFYNRDIGIAKILTPDEIDELKKDPENDLNFI